MSDLKICRICLQTEAKMYKFDRYQLMSYYEEVMAQKVNKRDGLPQHFCFECAALLHNFHKFKEKCYRGHKTLKELLWKGAITYERVYKVDRVASNLALPLGALQVSKNVKTYTSIHIDTDDEENLEKNQQIEHFVVDCTINVTNDPFNVVTEKTPEGAVVIFDSNLTIGGNDDLVVRDTEMNEEPTIPTTVFVNDKKEIVELVNEPVKEVKETTVAIVKPTKYYKFKKPTKFLDASQWKKIVLNEEEAKQQFRARAEDPKYLAFPYKCVDCFKGFSKKDMLKRHRALRHNESMPLECRFCSMRYKWATYLRKHMRQHFTKYECQKCLKICHLENTALLHDDYHNGVIKKCIHCNEEFTHLSTYYTHLRTHRSEYLCPICGVSFVSPAGLRQHKRLKHIDDETESADDDDEVNTYCETCDIRFETRKAYDEHLFHSAMHVEGVEDELKDEFSVPRKILGKREKAKITKELKTDRNKKAPVEASFRYTKKQGKLKRRSKKPTDCHQCGKHFDTQAACMKHHVAEHPGTSFYPSSERHICEICGASLAPGSVATHTNMHTKEKIFACDTCGRTFHAMISLKRHMLTHTGERPYGCTLCDKKFTQSNSMKLHYRTYHLKEPYPKRNRRKKGQPPSAEKAEESKTDESDESLPLELPPVVPTMEPPEEIIYLTLS